MSPRLGFGPPGSQWLYDQATKTYDLTRSACSPTLQVSTTYGPPSTSLLLSPAKTALVIVDMQNFFLHPSCRSHPAGLAAVDPLGRVIQRCREVGVQVVWLNWGLTDADLEQMPAGVLRGFASRTVSPSVPGEDATAFGLGEELGAGKGRTLCEGAWNSEIYDALQATKGAVDKAQDVFVAKNRMSGLWSERQPLWRYLREDAVGKEKQTLLFAGVNTDQCVLGTLTNAYSERLFCFASILTLLGGSLCEASTIANGVADIKNHICTDAGWDCIMIEDCCATTTPGAPEVCTYNVGVSEHSQVCFVSCSSLSTCVYLAIWV